MLVYQRIIGESEMLKVAASVFFAHDEARQADFGAEVSVIIEAEES